MTELTPEEQAHLYAWTTRCEHLPEYQELRDAIDVAVESINSYMSWEGGQK